MVVASSALRTRPRSQCVPRVRLGVIDYFRAPRHDHRRKSPRAPRPCVVRHQCYKLLLYKVVAVRFSACVHMYIRAMCTRRRTEDRKTRDRRQGRVQGRGRGGKRENKNRAPHKPCHRARGGRCDFGFYPSLCLVSPFFRRFFCRRRRHRLSL